MTNPKSLSMRVKEFCVQAQRAWALGKRRGDIRGRDCIVNEVRGRACKCGHRACPSRGA